MKVLVLSDIHSNIYALEAIWAQEKACDAVYCAGDLVDYGPYPREVIAWIQANHVPTVQGNHDAWVPINYRRGARLENIPPQERAWVHHNASLLTEGDIAFLEQLPLTLTFTLDGIDYAMTHLYREYEEIVSLHAFEQFRQERFGGADFARLILGHTHRQAIRIMSNLHLWLNPGSVSYRRRDDPDQTAHYATITDGRIDLHRLTYNKRPLFQVARTAGVNDQETATAVRFWDEEE